MGERRDQSNKTIFSLDDLQSIQKLIERINDAALAIEGGLEVLSSLRKFYDGLLTNQNFSLRISCKNMITTFGTQIRDIEKCFANEKIRANHLAKIVNNRKELV